MIAPTNNRVTQTKHGQYNAVDYSASPDDKIYAPEDGVIVSYENNGDCGNNLRMASGDRIHGFCHLNYATVLPKQRIKKGQVIGFMGYTGKTIPTGPAGTHLHWVVRTPQGYVYPPSLVNEKREESMKLTDKEADIIRILMSEVEGWNGHAVHAGQHDKQILGSWVGQDIRDMVRHGWRVQKVHRANLEDQLRHKNNQLSDLNKKITSLTTTIVELKKDDALDHELIEKLQKQVEEMSQSIPASEVDLDTNQKVTTIFNYFADRWATFRDFLRRK